ncbi:ABC transporter permease [Sphingobacterium corticibacterium]|uniref:FtsX-like permease family protein n=1 Tax=Sphingobacterium corticibacterium TaxID=2484746 RepID=A0A4Q6XLM7_9SPHI|nr:ABC transporter permease [Sphingobacterium corticibacterium]RZF58094.1 FtsX-like permease family protein [Sphingobacterium corticibacterium]
MIKIYFKTALRQIAKYQFHSILNVAGLGLAIAACLFIYAFNTYQLSFDRFHPDAERTFIVVEDLHLDQTEHNKGGPYAMYNAIRQELPQVEKAALYIDKQDFTLKIGNELRKIEGKACFTSSDYFEIMHFPWLAGSPQQLDEPATVALTKTMAKNFFGNEEAIGQTIWVENKLPVTVVGIIDDSRKNSDFQSEIYFSLASINEFRESAFFHNWGYTNSANNILLTLHHAEDKVGVEDSIRKLIAKHWHEDVLEYYTYKLLPLTAFHFNMNYGKATQFSLLGILTVIAIGILFMAGINYTNMVSAQQLYRSTEMGIRKVLGSSKRQLFLQFLIESLLISLFALLLAWLFLWIAIDWSNHYLFVNEPLQVLSLSKLIFISFVIWLSVCMTTSLFPAFFLNKTKIQAALKKQVANNWGLGRKALIFFQNVLALILIISTIVIVSQVRYLKNTDMGFNRETVLVFPLKNEMRDNTEKITAFLQHRSDILAFTFCDNPPSYDKVWGGTFKFDNRSEWETWAPRYAIGDSSYIKTFGIQLLAGHNFKDNEQHPEFLINEKMAMNLGYPDYQEIIGKDLHAGGLNDEYSGKIIGVVRDFSTNSLKEGVSPTVIGYNKGRIKNLAIKYRGNRPDQLLHDLEQEWKQWYPNELFDYKFYDEQIGNLYQKEALLEKLIWIAATISIIISSLGFLGLLSIMVVKRTKEIGIRKVLGANITGITLLLSKDFVRWVCVAFLFAIPIGWYLMNKWLDDFVYRIELQWWMFALTGFIGLLITLVTISVQTIRAAKTNPVDSLRDE